MTPDNYPMGGPGMAAEPKSSDLAFIKRWEISRSKGRWHYIFLSGVLMWGVPMFFALIVFSNQPDRRTLPGLTIGAVVCSIGGVLFGAMVWFFSERRYKRLASVSPEVGEK